MLTTQPSMITPVRRSAYDVMAAILEFTSDFLWVSNNFEFTTSTDKTFTQKQISLNFSLRSFNASVQQHDGYRACKKSFSNILKRPLWWISPNLLHHHGWLSTVRGCLPSWSGLSCCCCPYLEQSVPTCHICTLYLCFTKMTEGFPLQAFLPLTLYLNFCSACTVTLKLFFIYLLTNKPRVAVEKRVS